MAYANKGFALCQLKKYKEGISYYDKAIEIDPKEEIFILNKSSALYGLGKQVIKKKLSRFFLIFLLIALFIYIMFF